MSKQNCWEFFNCGREEGGAKVQELGVCPAATETRLDNINGGKNAGRTCWALARTLCEGMVQGDAVSKMAKCMACDFKKHVLKEEQGDFVGIREVLKIVGA
ncbi:MAG: hypothetical protein C0615_06905 [Desulfuromonas sp.]|nr:MAG: hypothetical protein C0615_06905 [Desulfuromonas sp.]